jgi:hypothetical protein
VQKKGEDTAQARTEIRLGLAAPREPIGEDGSAAQIRADEVAIDALFERCAGVIAELLEASKPGGRTAPTVFEGSLREIVHSVVVAVDAELGSQDWGVLERFDEKGARERSALGHQAEGYKFCPRTTRPRCPSELG